MAVGRKKTKSMIRKEIIRFLRSTSALPDKKKGKYRCGMVHRNALVLATSFKDMPRATALEFFHEGLTLYILGGPGSKIANIKRNPRVSAFVYEQPMDHSVVQKSLQLFGRAELINVRNKPRLFKAKAKKWNLYTVIKRLSRKDTEEMVEEVLYMHNFIKITPEHIIFKEYHPDFSMRKYEWKK